MKTTRQKEYTEYKGFSAQTTYQGSLMFLQLGFILVTGLFLMWGTSYFMNSQMQQPSCNHSKSL
jgi:hypothetical protein